MNIHRGLRGDRRIERTFTGGRRVVVVGHGRGFYERPYLNRGGRTYIQRTYVVRGRPYAVVYRSYYYGGVTYYRYVPAYYYHPVFYGWAYNPWVTPVYYDWGWAPDPWYGYYGYYFRPAPVYPTAALWLTDFLLAESLRLAYESRQSSGTGQSYAESAAPSGNGNVALSPEVKQAIAEEVRQQLAAEQQAAQPGYQASNDSEVPPALDPKQRIFVVSSNLDVVADNDQECVLTPGDIILRTGNEVLEGNMVEVSVQSSKNGDCAAGANTQLQVADLQEMHNHFREHIDAGLQQLAAKQGKGLPTPPDTSTVAGEVPAAAPDNDAETEIQNEQKQADQTEQDVVHQASNPGGDN